MSNPFFSTIETTEISGSPIGPASGDLSGNYPNPIVVKIQGTPVSATPPLLNQIFSFNGAQWIPITPSSAIPIDVQIFTSNGTWTKPATGAFVKVGCIGSGGGGGSGRRGINPSFGGGGGSGGASSQDTFLKTALPATVAVTVGTGGSPTNSTQAPGSGGGSSNIIGVAAGNGGNGGNYGSGGGGGGASINGANSGSGGNGASGVCVVVTY